MNHWKFKYEIETCDVLQEEIAKFLMDALNTYLRRRGGGIVILDSEIVKVADA